VQVLPHFSEKEKEPFGAGYPLVWYKLKHLFNLVKKGYLKNLGKKESTNFFACIKLLSAK